MPKTKLFAAALFSVTLAGTGLAQVQSPPAPGTAGKPPAQQDMQHTKPMQGGMCGPSGCGMGAPAQSTPMQGMMQQGQGGCPMMQRSAALERRVRQLEERLGIPAPPTPTQPGSPG